MRREIDLFFGNLKFTILSFYLSFLMVMHNQVMCYLADPVHFNFNLAAVITLLHAFMVYHPLFVVLTCYNPQLIPAGRNCKANTSISSIALKCIEKK